MNRITQLAITLTLSLGTLLGTSLGTSLALAAPDQVGVHEHDGFFLRFQAGPGYTRMSSDSMEIGGAGFGFNFALGGRVAPNLLLFGEISQSVSDEPTVKMKGAPGSLSLSDITGSILGLGAGLAYYLPGNVYLSGALTLSQISFSNEDGKELADTKYGPGLVLSVGKDWWVSSNWGLGIAAVVYGNQVKDREFSLSGSNVETWKSVGAALALSATFN